MKSTPMTLSLTAVLALALLEAIFSRFVQAMPLPYDLDMDYKELKGLSRTLVSEAKLMWQVPAPDTARTQLGAG